MTTNIFNFNLLYISLLRSPCCHVHGCVLTAVVFPLPLVNSELGLELVRMAGNSWDTHMAFLSTRGCWKKMVLQEKETQNFGWYKSCCYFIEFCINLFKKSSLYRGFSLWFWFLIPEFCWHQKSILIPWWVAMQGLNTQKNTTKTTVFIICIQIIDIKIVCSQYIRPIKIGGTKTIF